MKKTQWIELFSTIKNTIIPFSALILFIAMSVAFYTSMDWSSQSLGISIEKDFEVFSMHDLEIFYPLGFDEEQLQSIQNSADIDTIEGIYLAYPKFELDGTVYQGRIMSLSETLDQPHNIAGRLPSQPGEIAVEAAAAEKLGFAIGDTVTFIHDDDGHAYDVKNIRDGQFDHLIRENPTPDGMKYLTTDTFTITATLEHPAYSGISDLSYGLEPEHSIPVNLVFFVSENSFDTNAFDGYVDILISCENLRGVDSLSEEFETLYEPIKHSVSEEAERIAAQEKSDLYDALQNMLKEHDIEIHDMEEYLAADENNAENRTASRLAALQPVVTSRRYNSARNTLDILGDIFSNMKYSISIMFFIVSLLICFFDITRIVKSREELIGIKRALGFTRHELLTSLIAYSSIAVIAGCILGFFLSRFLLEPVMLKTAYNSFVLEHRVQFFSVRDILLLSLFELLLMLFITVLAGRKIISLPAVRLLYGSPVTCGKARIYETTRLWKNLSLFSKTIVNNCMNDPRRVLSTLTGIAGCTALMVCAVFVRDTLDATFSHHFESIEHYNAQVFFDADAEGCAEKISNILTEKNIPFTMIHTSMGTLDNGRGRAANLHIVVPMDDNFEKFVEIHPASGEPTETQVWFTEAIARNMNLHTGDSAFYTSPQKSAVSLPVEGIMQFYMFHSQVIITRDAYRNYFDMEALPNAMLLQSDLSPRELTSLLSGINGFCYVSDYSEVCSSHYRLLAKISLAIIVIFTLLSVIMALLVLLTLLVMFVEDKKRELTILMINGYSLKKARQYIYSDTILLTVLGILLGVILGECLGFAAADSLATQHSVVYKQISIKAAVTGGLCSAVFSYAMTQIALLRIKTFHLSDINYK